MFWTKNFPKVAGIILLLLVVCQVLAVVFGAPAMDADPLKKDEIASMLDDIHDNETVFALGGAFDLIVDSVWSIAAAAVVYLLFRRRDRVLATLTLTFILAASGAFMVGDAMNISLLFVADDFANGGAEGIAPGSESLLELGRTIALAAGIVFQAASTALAAGFITAGVLITFSPEGEGANPPRWVGWPAIAAGVLVIASALVFVSTGLFVLLIAGMILSLVWLVLLGGWLLLRAPADLDVTAV